MHLKYLYKYHHGRAQCRDVRRRVPHGEAGGGGHPGGEAGGREHPGGEEVHRPQQLGHVHSVHRGMAGH